MTSKTEFSGKDVAQAIQAACAAMDVAQDKLNIDVLATGSTGFLGFGRKDAKVSVTLKDASGDRDGRNRKGGSSENGGRKNRDRKGGGRRPRGPEKPPAEISEEILDNVHADLTNILEMMGFPSEVEVSNEANKICAHITGEYVDDIVGAEGQTLDGLQYLLRKMISRSVTGKVMFSLDAGDYRENRRHELEETALKMAGEVKETTKTRSIPALNPAERRIVHMTLQDDTEIRSRSVGDGHFKKILIYLPGKGKKRQGGGGRRR